MDTDEARWLRQANEDLTTARILFESRRYGPCAFFCQQAAEKALKAVVYSCGEKPWGHSVPALLDQVCAVVRVEPDHVPVAEAEALDEHYTRSRYPDARPQTADDYSQETAEEALSQAHAVLAFVEDTLRHA
jgi:HEPN domain-containing protein